MTLPLLLTDEVAPSANHVGQSANNIAPSADNVAPPANDFVFFANDVAPSVFELGRDFATFSRLIVKCRIFLESARHRCRMIILNIAHFDQWSDTCYIVKYSFLRLFSV